METEEVFDSPRERVRAHLLRYLATDGEEGFIWNGVPTLLLTTRGRRSRCLRRTALIFGRHGDEYLVVGSRGGAPKHPLWVENLLVDPRVIVQIKGSVFSATARLATASERPGFWQTMTEIWPAYDEYQEKTEREIPVIVISVTHDETRSLN
ncbi:MAG TPA: nitroreductase family deazaflavin-dependent oxidoreductase [Acidimicrobiales bacterium]|nr:nitroreductase family deazaflavin-dependent oxidoreductase [Acidimicrobiales bacterium]